MNKVTSVRMLPGGQIICLSARGEVQNLRSNALIELAERAEEKGHNLDGVLCECEGQGVFRLVKSSGQWAVEMG